MMCYQRVESELHNIRVNLQDMLDETYTLLDSQIVPDTLSDYQGATSKRIIGVTKSLCQMTDIEKEWRDQSPATRPQLRIVT